MAEAKNRLSELIDRAHQGESVLIEREGVAVAEITPVRAKTAEVRAPRPVSEEGLAWLDKHRITPAVIGDSAKLIREMRDEDDH